MTTLPPTDTIPETKTPRDIGAQMATLRTQFKLTPQDVSERLHIRARYITAMEQGRLELMPGKVYARGYVHTYAEFLGLNPDEVVRQCFAGEPPPVAATTLHKPSTLEHRPALPWRGLVTALAVGLGLWALLGLFAQEPSDEAAPVAVIAAVPEDLLATVRTTVMPSPSNVECLTGERILGCFFADKTVRGLMRPVQPNSLPFVGTIELPSPIEEGEGVDAPLTSDDE